MSTIRVVYVAGPMTVGDWQGNVRNAIDAADKLAEAGFVPVVPHLNSTWHLLHPHDHAYWMRLDFAILERCDAVLRLPGESKGADAEEKHARSIGLHVVAPETLSGLDIAIRILGLEPEELEGWTKPSEPEPKPCTRFAPDNDACTHCACGLALAEHPGAELVPTRPRGLQILDALSNLAVRLSRLEQQNASNQ